MSRRDVLIHGATAAGMWVAGLEFPEDARSWPGRTKQSLGMNIVGAGSAGAGFATGLSADGQRRRALVNGAFVEASDAVGAGIRCQRLYAIWRSSLSATWSMEWGMNTGMLCLE